MNGDSSFAIRGLNMNRTKLISTNRISKVRFAQRLHVRVTILTMIILTMQTHSGAPLTMPSFFLSRTSMIQIICLTVGNALDSTPQIRGFLAIHDRTSCFVRFENPGYRRYYPRSIKFPCLETLDVGTSIFGDPEAFRFPEATVKSI
jgi:hypothetical protein